MKIILALQTIIFGIASAYDATVPVTQWTGCSADQTSNTCSWYGGCWVCNDEGGAYLDHPGSTCPVNDALCPTEP